MISTTTWTRQSTYTTGALLAPWLAVSVTGGRAGGYGFRVFVPGDGRLDTTRALLAEQYGFASEAEAQAAAIAKVAEMLAEVRL